MGVPTPVWGNNYVMLVKNQVLSDRYQIDEPIGRGGMASVYRGTDRVLSRTVAVKVLTPELSDDPSFVDRFRHEARAAAGLNHPGVVGVFDTGSDGNRHYIVMEHLEGRTLAEVLREDGALPPDRALPIAEQVAEALQAAHAAGLVHRDVKPSNVMITPTGAVKVMDFGIARAAAGSTFTQTGMVMGTATYFSPEQARGDPVDARSDVYSLGAVLYEMLTGRPPFIAPTAVAVATMHVQVQPEPPSHVNPTLPAALDGLVLRSLEKDPALRYGSAQEFAGALRSAQATMAGPPAAGTEPVPPVPTDVLPAVVPAPTPEPPRHVAPAARPRPRRSQWPLLVVVLGSALLVILLLWLFTRNQTNRSVLPPASPSSTQATSSSPATSPSSTPSPSPQPTSPTVDQAATNLADAVADGVAAGEVSDRAAEFIGHQASDALKEHGRGDTSKALDRLAHLHDKVDELRAKGDITSQDRAARIHQAITDLENAMRAGGAEGD